MAFNWSLIAIITILNLTLGVLALIRNPRNKVNRFFFSMVFFTTAWMLSNYLENENLGIFLRSFFLRLDFALAPFLVFFFLLFCLNFSELLLKKKIKISLIVLAIIFAIFSFSDYLIKNIEIANGTIIFKTGLLFLPYALFIISLVGFGCYALINSYRKSVGLKKAQSLYALTGLSLTAFVILLLNLILPQIIFIPLSVGRIGIYSLIFFIFFTFYAIVKYRLLDIRLVIGRGAVYLFSFTTVVAFGFLIVFLNNRLANPFSFNFIGPLIALFSVLIFQPFFRVYKRIASRYFYYTFYSYQKVLTDLGKKLAEVLELDKLSSLIVETLIKTMKLDRTVILLREVETGNYQIQKNIGFKEENGISLVKDNFLTIYLKRTKKPVVLEELSLAIRDAKTEEERVRLEKLRSNMKRIEAELCLPLFAKEELTGIIVLGKKISGDPYSEQDLNLLNNLSNQSSIALENAKLYSQVEDLSKNLQKRVEEQVRNIKKLLEDKEKLLNIKADFLQTVNHQLRTPVSIFRGYLEWWKEGTIEKFSKEKQKEFQEKIIGAAERLNNVINDVLVALELGGAPKFSFENVDIKKIVQEIIDELQPGFQKKDLKIILFLPESFPKIQADPLFLKQALQNLIDNATKYTPEKGEIEIKLTQLDEENVQFSIKDSGIGITEEERENLFKEKFFRGKEAVNLVPNGSGLGLYIVKEIIGHHQGTIEIKSEGRNKGSKFIVTLPILQPAI